MESPTIIEARKYCKTNKLRYMIKNDALYLFVPTYKMYMRTCFNILNFDKDSIKEHIDKQIYMWNLCNTTKGE